MKRKIAVLLSFIMVFSLISVVPVQAKAKIKLSKKKLTMYAGQSKKIKVKGTRKKVKWTSSKKSVVTVKSGKLKAKKAGKATVKARVAGKTLKCKVTVKRKKTTKKPDKNTPAGTPGNSSTNNTAKGSLNHKSATIDIMQSVQLKLTGAVVKSWKSGDEDIATVDGNGKVTAVQKGNTTIICTDTSGATYECKIYVIYPDIKFNSNFLSKGTNYDMYYLTFNIVNNTDYNCRLGGADSMTGKMATVAFLYLYGFNAGSTAAYFVTTTPQDIYFDTNETIELPANKTSLLYLIAGKSYGIQSSTNYLWTLTIEDTKFAVLTDITGYIVAMVKVGKSDVAVPSVS